MIFFSENDLLKLKEDLKTSNKAAYAFGSRRNLKIQWESFLLFCFYFKLTHLPAKTETLQLYAQFLSRTFKSTQSIKNYLNGIKTMHLLLGHAVEHINKFILNLSLKGIAKLNPHCIKQAECMTPAILLKISQILDFSNKSDVVFWCLFLFAFFLLARKSNLIPTTKKDLAQRKFLLRGDIIKVKDILIVTMFWSKTIQAGERMLQTPLLPIKGSVLCPVRAFICMCKAVPATMDAPLFLLPSRKPITYLMFQNKLKSCIKAIGLDPSNFSSHSFRRGGATLLFNANIEADKIQLLGDWRSEAYKKYLTFTLEDKIQVSKEMRHHLLHKISVSSK